MERFYDQVSPLLPTTMAKSTSGGGASSALPRDNPSGKPVRGIRIKYLCSYFLVLGLGLTFILLLLSALNLYDFASRSSDAASALDRDLHYAVVVDAGSSGSRAYLYAWPTHSGNPHELLNISPLTGQDGNPLYKKVTPGLSSLKSNPEGALNYIAPLMEFAMSHIPATKVKETPLYILATAGMRLLAKGEQDAIVSNLRRGIQDEFEFLFPEGNLEIITGKQEGIYQWLAINYVLGKFRHHEKSGMVALKDDESTKEGDNLVLRPRTVGALDMGGASMQIAMEITSSLQMEGMSEKERAQVFEINLGCKDHDMEHTYRIFVNTFLGYGANEALARHRRDLVLSQVEENVTEISGLTADSRISDPCLPVNYLENVTMSIDPDMFRVGGENEADGSHQILKDQLKRDSNTIFLKGTGDWTGCYDSLKSFAGSKEEYSKCASSSCPDAGIKVPSIQFESSEFYGFSEFWYSMEDVLRMGGPYMATKFKSAAQQFCETPWENTWSKFVDGQYPKADKERVQTQCFKANWLTVVLHEGLSFPLSYSHLSAAPETVNGKVVHWTLGALLYRTRFLPLREIEARQVHHGKYHSAFESGYLYSHYIVLICLALVIAAILVYLERLKRYVRPSTLRRVPSVTSWLTSSSPPRSISPNGQKNGLSSRTSYARLNANRDFDEDDELLTVTSERAPASGQMSNRGSSSNLVGLAKAKSTFSEIFIG